MRDHDHRLAKFAIRVAQKLHDLTAVVRIEIAGRLISEHDRWRIHERTADRHTLLLSTRELARQMPFATMKRKTGQKRLEPLCVHLAPIERNRQGHILDHIENRNQIIELIHESHFAATEDRKLFIAARIDIDTIEKDAARSRAIDPADQMQKRRLARSRRSDDRDEFAFFHAEAHIIERTRGGFALSIHLREMLNFQDFHDGILSFL